MPLGVRGRFTLTKKGASRLRRTSRTSSIQGFRAAKSGSSPFMGTLKAAAEAPRRKPCLAAATVPECQISFPRLLPRLTPERTRSTGPRRCIPKATQSAGVPRTR
jgi:hypothetical protein